MAATKRKNMNPRIERKITRISGVREVKQTFLIICEGVNTEPDYFNAFRLTSATVKAIGQGMGTLAVILFFIHSAVFTLPFEITQTGLPSIKDLTNLL